MQVKMTQEKSSQAGLTQIFLQNPFPGFLRSDASRARCLHCVLLLESCNHEAQIESERQNWNSQAVTVHHQRQIQIEKCHAS